MAHIKGRRLGHKELPKQSGLWGVLLPRPGEEAVAHEPDAQDVVRRLDDSCLVFENAMHAGNRGFLFAFCLRVAKIEVPDGQKRRVNYALSIQGTDGNALLVNRESGVLFKLAEKRQRNVLELRLPISAYRTQDA